MKDLSVRHSFLRVSGISMHVAEAGTGPPLLLLHGFPELWYSWRYQLAGLGRSFRVVAPDLRGYGETEKPASGYDLSTLAEDVSELLSALGEQKAFVCGHDWGGAIAWHLAARHPERVSRLVIINCPHTAVFLSRLWRSPSQMLRSSYMLFFQIPRLPEWLLRARKAALLEWSFRRSFRRRDALGEADLAIYRTAWLTPGALEGGLAYYRTMTRKLLRGGHQRTLRSPVSVPTLLLWGEKDWALSRELTVGTERYLKAPLEKRFLPEAGHFAHQDAPEEVNRRIEDFLTRAEI